jgi:hypothetical protein
MNPRTALLDLDGVICDDRHRVDYALRRDWGTYFGLMGDDAVWRQGRELYEACTITGWDVAYLTGRRDQFRGHTRRWLKQHGFDADLPLLMRPDDSSTRLAVFKAGIVADMLRDYEALMLYDDDPEVIKVVGQVQGVGVRHCTWHVKPERMVKKALS